MNLKGVHLQQTQNIASSNMMTLKQDQVLYGTIKKLFPNQQAEIQLGNQKMMAKLETPMSAGNAHYFQVTATEPELQLKVVSGPLQATNSPQQQAKQLLESMKITSTKEMQQLVTSLIKSDTPVTKGQLQQANTQLNNLPSNISKTEATEALQKLIQLKIPISADTMKAVAFGELKNGFTTALQNLSTSLTLDETISGRVKADLLMSLQTLKTPLASEMGAMLVSKFIDALINATPNTKQAVLQMFKEANILPANATTFNWAQTLLNQSNNNELTLQSLQQLQAPTATNAKQLLTTLQQSLSTHTNLTIVQKEQLLQLIQKAMPEPSNQQLKVIARQVQQALQQVEEQLPTLLTKLQQSSVAGQNHIIRQMHTAIDQSTLSETAKKALLQSLGQFIQNSSTNQVKDIQQQLLKGFSEDVLNNPMQQSTATTASSKEQLLKMLTLSNPQQMTQATTLLSQLASQSNNAVIQNIYQQVEQSLQANMDGKVMEAALKNTLKSLGFSYEAKLTSQTENIQHLKEQLKPQLVSLLQSNSGNEQTRMQAEQLVSRLNGQQLLSADNGVQQQIVMQVPLQFFGKKTEATVQWNGQMKKDGQIDANYARVMFYLDLEALAETVIDMQVQSRVVTLNVYNESNELQPFADLLKETLANGLAAANYRLSGVFMKPFTSEETMKTSNLKSAKVESEQGVDIRI